MVGDNVLSSKTDGNTSISATTPSDSTESVLQWVDETSRQWEIWEATCEFLCFAEETMLRPGGHVASLPLWWAVKDEEQVNFCQPWLWQIGRWEVWTKLSWAAIAKLATGWNLVSRKCGKLWWAIIARLAVGWNLASRKCRKNSMSRDCRTASEVKPCKPQLRD